MQAFRKKSGKLILTDRWTDRRTECKPIVPFDFAGRGLIILSGRILSLFLIAFDWSIHSAIFFHLDEITLLMKINSLPSRSDYYVPHNFSQDFAISPKVWTSV